MSIPRTEKTKEKISESTQRVPHQGCEQMVEDEVNSHNWSPHMTHSHEGLVHDIYPALLGQDLEHGHEGLQGGKLKVRYSERGRGTFGGH